MSLLGSISTAVTGLTAQSKCLGNISDNLSNATTMGFKTIVTNFEDIVADDSGPRNKGTGVIATPSYRNNLQGSISSSDIDTNVAISGKGFFVVSPITSDGLDTDALSYTRTGDFSLNNEGYLQNSAGYCLMGWNIDQATGAVETGSIIPLQFTDLINSGVATTVIDFAANLPASIAAGASTTDSSTTIYDSEGQSHTLTYAWDKTTVNTWNLTVTAPGGAYDAGTDTENDYTATATFVFDGTGQIQSVTSSDCTVTGTGLSFPLYYKYTDPDTHAVSAVTQTTNSRFGSVTQYADTNINVLSFSRNGAAKGSFSSITIDNNGFASINYDNGVSQAYYQVPIALFNAPQSLERMTGGIYRETLASGDVSYAVAGTSGAGKLTVSALEGSTVDIADQFTRMIQAQRAYSANARTVTTADTMMRMLMDI